MLRVPLVLTFGNLIFELVSDFDTCPPPEESNFEFCLVTFANHTLWTQLKAGPSRPVFFNYARGDIPVKFECVGEWEHVVLIADHINKIIF